MRSHLRCILRKNSSVTITTVKQEIICHHWYKDSNIACDMILQAVRYLKNIGTEFLWPAAMFNRSRRKRSPARHSTYVCATNSLHQMGAHTGLHNGKGNEAKAENVAQMY